MVETAIVERVFCVVDRCLRNQFPDDYYKRCMYASFGVHRLLQALGYSPVIVGGNFGAFVVSRDQRKASIQGYSSDSGDHSHYWVELDGSIIDLGSYYLPVESSFQACDVPAVFWNASSPLPKGLIYSPAHRYPSSDISHLAPHIIEKMKPFLAACYARMAKPLAKPRLGKWLVTTPSSIQKAARKGDSWALAMIRYESMSVEHPVIG
ncbi:hypothetical protein [Pseudomonas nitroreducens]|uniref:hypothetical protein n=2 Tax=Pseudomonas nitroreducens TaxID=46680 RepID=UPI001E5F1034|nr:hypothetical protein [Pseudomonas nitroreducens]